jgi:hypothetical protein
MPVTVSKFAIANYFTFSNILMIVDAGSGGSRGG